MPVKLWFVQATNLQGVELSRFDWHLFVLGLVNSCYDDAILHGFLT